MAEGTTCEHGFTQGKCISPSCPFQLSEAERLAWIAQLEKKGELDPTCPMCRWAYIGKTKPFQPSHKASELCESGKHSHCSCDTCF